MDAAVAAVLMSFVAESPLTGPGAGGFMLVHTSSGENHLLDFFVAAPGTGIAEPDPAPLVPIDVEFAEGAIQRFNCGPSSCGAYGTTAGLAEALDRFGTTALSDLTAAPAKAAREGVEVIPMHALLFEILGPIVRSTPEVRRSTSPRDARCARGRRIFLPGAGRPARPPGRRGTRVPLRGGRRRCRERLGAGARGTAHPRGPRVV